MDIVISVSAGVYVRFLLVGSCLPMFLDSPWVPSSRVYQWKKNCFNFYLDCLTL